MNISVAVAGASGRLGSVICDVVEELAGFELQAKIGSGSAPDVGSDADVLIDATNFEVSQKIVFDAVARGQKVIVATSGWDAERLAVLEEAVSANPGAGVIVVPNFSLGSVLGTHLAQIVAPYFATAEIIETHHHEKVDSPSGTAVRTAELIAAKQSEISAAPFAQQPARGQTVAGVPVHSLRMQGVVAKQEVHFGGVGETLSITHDTLNSDSYKPGIRAALAAIHTHEGLTIGLAELLGIKK